MQGPGAVLRLVIPPFYSPLCVISLRLVGLGIEDCPCVIEWNLWDQEKNAHLGHALPGQRA